MLDDDTLDQEVDTLKFSRISDVWAPHETGAKANRQVIGLHHVLIAVLGYTVHTK